MSVQWSRILARTEVANAIAAANRHGRTVVIAHSLGSVVTYETLHAYPQLHVAHLITLGSPLALPHAVFDRLLPAPRPRGAGLANTGRWTNIADVGDLVAVPREVSATASTASTGMSSPPFTGRTSTWSATTCKRPLWPRHCGTASATCLRPGKRRCVHPASQPGRGAADRVVALPPATLNSSAARHAKGRSWLTVYRAWRTDNTGYPSSGCSSEGSEETRATEQALGL